MKLIEKYLEKLQDNATGFAIDSFPEKKSVMRVVYPEQFVPNIDNRHNRILIDFDGVINPYSKGWNNGQITDPPIPGVKEAIDQLKQQGLEIIIFTTRASTLQNVNPSSQQLVEDLRKWLDEYEIQYDAITSEKVSALAYIDDKAIRFTNWQDVLEQVNEIIENEQE